MAIAAVSTTAVISNTAAANTGAVTFTGNFYIAAVDDDFAAVLARFAAQRSGVCNSVNFQLAAALFLPIDCQRVALIDNDRLVRGHAAAIFQNQTNVPLDLDGCVKRHSVSLPDDIPAALPSYSLYTIAALYDGRIFRTTLYTS